MSEIREHTCAETGRMFPSEADARASEARFCHVQSQCEAGLVPELRLGDVIYLDTDLYVSHGRDDFRGGLGEVTEVKMETVRGKPALFIRAAQQPDTLHNWDYLAPMQAKLRREFGKNWSHPDPDFRPEFNEW